MKIKISRTKFEADACIKANTNSGALKIEGKWRDEPGE